MIFNKTKNQIICKEKKILNTILEKAIGLMFSKQINDIGYIFIFDKPIKVSLHMFFVFFPIDVIFLNENKKVIEIKKNFKPFTFYNSKNKIKYFIELRKGISNNIDLNDEIIF